jgi:hypothetical protein
MPSGSPDSDIFRQAHPLAVALIERLRGLDAYVLELGSGKGRNTRALHAAGLTVQSIADADAQNFEPRAQTFDAALSTHALLHGTPAIVAVMAGAAARALKAGSPFYCTFGSKRDARYGKGVEVAVDTYAPASGDEQGVAHAYFNDRDLRSILEPHFVIETLTEEHVEAVVGSWAHATRPVGSVHWFLQAHKRAPQS